MITSEKQSEPRIQLHAPQGSPPAYGESSSGASPTQAHNPYFQQHPQPQILYPPPGSPYQEGPPSSPPQVYPPRQAQQPWSPNMQDPMARDAQIGQNYQAAREYRPRFLVSTNLTLYRLCSLCTRKPRAHDEIRCLRYHCCRPLISHRSTMLIVSLDALFVDI